MLPVKGEKGEDVTEKLEEQAPDALHDEDEVTDEDRRTLRRVPAAIPWASFLIAVCELSERFSYYGTVQVFQNFIENPLPIGSTTGADPSSEGTPGALGRGQTAATGLTTFNQFWVYCMPLLGGYLADAYLGRFRTIKLAVYIAIVGHIILVICAIPPVIKNPNGSMAAFAVAIIVMGLGTGMFKSTVSPLMAEQVGSQKQRIATTNKGERVIVDPTITSARLFNFFYLMINIGAIGGQVSMTFAEKYEGFYLAFTLPTVVFLICIPILHFGRHLYKKTPPSGSVLGTSMRVWRYALTHRSPQHSFWDSAKPSNIEPDLRPRWMTFDDAWVDEIRRGFKACYIFALFPFYWICYNQISSNLISQAKSLTRNGVPNEIVSNLDPLSIIIFVPVFEFLVYPGLRRLGINFTALKRIFAGFMCASAAMVWSAVVQHYIYRQSPCLDRASECDDPAPLSVWVQTGPYVLIGISEIFASVTGLEYAFTKAPKNMRSLVMGAFLFTSALGSALQQAFLPLVQDPRLVWMYTTFAVIAFIAGVVFRVATYSIDQEEDRLNNLDEGQFHVTKQ
ncbi:putative PTR2-Di-and tripeptide permease [Acaromyces ingoldii]|uniref:Putative PTR2-Di-and tripeptide permease n=1 Tax=Acaromyces ingoldii TaxID=215250 RepID=A0A316YHF1_9BASI|nr:putative PTR2-Di-and tripeptide permease [Acaromyces ingoldii]PWN88857.1 putative PTR2-Di-and tripeptide permease [Acaromyces ingoldii]